MNYSHQFTVKASVATVADFHVRSSSMAAITPPPIVVQIHEAPSRLAEGDKMDFTLWLGPLPIRWVARIEAVSETGFDDRQLDGPFEQWVHRHRYQPIAEGVTHISDEIQFSLKKHPWWGIIGLVMGLNLPLLFTYRGWKTRQLLANRSIQPVQSSS